MNENLKFGLAFAGIVTLIVSAALLAYALVNAQYPFKAKPTFTLVQAFTDASATTEYSLTENDLGTIDNGTTQILYIKNSGSEQASVTLAISSSTYCNIMLNNTAFLLNPSAIEPVAMTIYFTGTNEATWNLDVAS